MSDERDYNERQQAEGAKKALEDSGVRFTKKAVDVEGVDPETRRRLEGLDPLSKTHMEGVAGAARIEGIVNFIDLPNEKRLSSANDTHVIMGRDRPSHRASGYGGLGDTGASALDLVVGLGSAELTSNMTEPAWVDRNFDADAARIYISQKTDVDNNFFLATGSVGNAVAKSAVAVKADNVRIIAREGIKLITRTDEKNSQGGPVTSCVGIDLIAGNDDQDLQPLVKGKSLAKTLKALADTVSALSGVVFGLVTYQNQINKYVQSHTHVGNKGAPTSPSTDLLTGIPKPYSDLVRKTQMDCTKLKEKVGNFKLNHCENTGADWFNSQWNNTN
tara:strand:+ start:165 stop:1160 length:996 start_codon:yes stop_codon:yes gene_type:complete